MKKILIITISTLLLFTTGCGKKKEEVETKKPTIIDKIHVGSVDNFTITLSPIKYENGLSTINATITNDSNDSKYLDSIDIKFLISNEESYIVRLTVGEELEANQSVYVSNTENLDLSKSLSIEYFVGNSTVEKNIVSNNEEYE